LRKDFYSQRVSDGGNSAIFYPIRFRMMSSKIESLRLMKLSREWLQRLTHMKVIRIGGDSIETNSFGFTDKL